MHGKGSIQWADGRKYIGVNISKKNNYCIFRNISMTKSTAMVFLNGLTIENMLEDGLMVNTF